MTTATAASRRPSDDDIVRVRRGVRLAPIAEEYTLLTRASENTLTGVCPLPGCGSSGDQFEIAMDRDVYRCNGCGEGGDLIIFVQKVEGISFRDAVEKLANRAGIELRYEQGPAPVGPVTPERLRHFELDAKPFTAIELHVIANFEEAIAGMDDTLSDVGLAGDGWPEEFSADDITGIYKSYFDMTREWYQALDSLKADLTNGGEGPRHSVAGHKYLKHACLVWYRALHMLRREACKHAYGTAGPEPEVEAGYLTFFDIPGIELDGRIAAESSY